MIDIKKTILAITMILMIFVVTFPFLFMIKLSIQPEPDIYRIPIKFIPSISKFSNYIDIHKSFPVLKQFSNSIIYASVASLLSVVTATLAAYPLAKLKPPGHKWLIRLVLIAILLPPGLRAIQLYTIMANWGWVDTWVGMILPLAATGFATFWMYQYMITIPNEMIEAGRIDGASEFQILRFIIVPISRSAIGTLMLYMFIFRWRDYIWPLIMTKGNVTTLSVGLAQYSQGGELLIKWHMVATMAVFLFVPTMILFLMLRRVIMGAVTVSLK